MAFCDYTQLNGRTTGAILLYTEVCRGRKLHVNKTTRPGL
jgi:hypothetical protein